MQSSLEIRKAQKSDAGSIVQFNMAMALETEQKILPKDKIDAGVRSLLKNSQYGFYMVAEQNGTIVGSLMITTEWSDWRNGIFWWIQSVYVIPEFRRQGIYRAMYMKVKEEAKGVPNICGFRLYVERDNLIAQKTYSDLGMTETHYKMYEELR
jgi:ribosomal protein S18 acetylase RimI-like enzyme